MRGEEDHDDCQAIADAEQPARPDGLPRGFAVREDGVWRRIEGEDGSEWKWLCSPLRVLALPRDRSGIGWGRLVEVIDPDGRAHRTAIPAELFAGDGREVRALLMRLGLDLASAKGARTAIADLLMQWRPRARALTAARLGWADETCSAFVLGDGRVIGGEGLVVYQSADGPGPGTEMRAAGDLAGWRETVAAPCVGNPLLLVAVSLAFAGPLLEPLGFDGGGIHLRGASSRGKSTAQRAAVSVWGSPAFLASWRATSNGLEGVATACNSTLLALDEMGEVSGREAGAAAYMLSNGAAKHRAGRSGAARPSARWRVMILSSGELSLADKIAEAGGRAAAGQEVRLLDVAADGFTHGAFEELHGARDGAAFADRMRAATAEHYGTAGPAFVAAFLEHRERHVDGFRAAVASFVAAARERFDLGDEGQALRAVARLGLIAAAGEVASIWGLTGWPKGAARTAAFDVLGLWLEGRGGAGPAEAREAVERVRAFITAHGASRFSRIRDGGETGDDRIPHRAGWRCADFFWIAPSVWKSEIHAGADPRRAARHLAAAGFLHSDADGRLTRRTPRGVEARPRAYAVPVSILGGDDEL